MLRATVRARDRTMTETTHRLFIAAAIPEAIKREIAALQRHLGRHDCDVRWVRSPALHVTLRFLGETPERLLEQVKEAVKTVADATWRAELSVEGTGFFPNRRNPKIVWVGVTQGADVLSGMAAMLDRELEQHGFEPERRPYSPHITIGRIRRAGDADSLIDDAGRGFEAMSMPLRDILLIESDLRPNGPVYTVLGTYNLKG
ncbi:RNA 2',3'-cyclic phosphodiesterase [bacterium]|nr:RNA 2',3'-cyclic phosphodiesterase [bacterium]